ncbi:hypothetical protein CsatA_012006 [Cannabis sativa]
MVSWILDPFSGAIVVGERKKFTQVVVGLCMDLWKVRNSTFHEGSIAPPKIIICRTLSDIEEFRRIKFIISNDPSSPKQLVTHSRGNGMNVLADAAVRGFVAFAVVLALNQDDQIVEDLSAKV